MVEKNGRVITDRVNFNIMGRQYYVVSESSGLPSAEFFDTGGNMRGGVIVRRDWEHSGDIRE